MNVRQAKELDLVAFIEGLGFHSTSVRGNDVWFRSPFRPDERTPSFKVDASKRIWYDFGIGQGGTIIDFVEQLEQTPDVAGALAFIDRAAGGGVVVRSAASVKAREAAPKAKPVIEHVGLLSSPRLEAYLGSRAIPVDLARVYLQEIRYRVDERSYLALAFENDAGGFEVRTPDWKGSVGTKDITTLLAPSRQDFAVFEGSLDFLSTMAFYGVERPRANVLVLNSVSLLDRALLALQAREAERVFAYFDHDQAGTDALARLEEQQRFQVRDSSGFYTGFKDANAFLQQARQRTSSEEQEK